MATAGERQPGGARGRRGGGRGRRTGRPQPSLRRRRRATAVPTRRGTGGGLMEVVLLPSADDAAQLLADAIDELVRRRPDAVLGLATGSSPLLTYRKLVERHRQGSGPSYAA